MTEVKAQIIIKTFLPKRKKKTITVHFHKPNHYKYGISFYFEKLKIYPRTNYLNVYITQWSIKLELNRICYLNSIRQIHWRKHQNCILLEIYFQFPPLRSNLKKTNDYSTRLAYQRNLFLIQFNKLNFLFGSNKNVVRSTISQYYLNNTSYHNVSSLWLVSRK